MTKPLKKKLKPNNFRRWINISNQDMKQPPYFVGLPRELIANKVLTHLTIFNLRNIKNTCKGMKELADQTIRFHNNEFKEKLRGLFDGYKEFNESIIKELLNSFYSNLNENKDTNKTTLLAQIDMIMNSVVNESAFLLKKTNHCQIFSVKFIKNNQKIAHKEINFHTVFQTIINEFAQHILGYPLYDIQPRLNHRGKTVL